MDEDLSYYSDICGLVNLDLMKRVNDDTVDDPKPKRVKESKDLNPNFKKKIRNPPKDDIDEDAGPTTPKQRFNKRHNLNEDDEDNSNQISRKGKKFEERDNSNSYQKNDRKFIKGDKFEKGGRLERGGKFEKGKKFDRGGKFDKGGRSGRRFNNQ